MRIAQLASQKNKYWIFFLFQATTAKTITTHHYIHVNNRASRPKMATARAYIFKISFLYIKREHSIKFLSLHLELSMYCTVQVYIHCTLYRYSFSDGSALAYTIEK